VLLENVEVCEDTGVMFLHSLFPMLLSLTTLFGTLFSIFRSRAALELDDLAEPEKTPEIDPVGPLVGMGLPHLERLAPRFGEAESGFSPLQLRRRFRAAGVP